MQYRAAIYARYSTDLQSDRSIADQVELCRDYMKREGYHEVEVFADRAMSSETLIGRTGLASLLEAARNKSFDAVVVECVDRISRDSGDLHQVSKILRFSDIDIVSANEGVQNEIQIGFRGLMGTMFLKDLREKIHRGMVGNIREGLSAGGKAYGYSPVHGKAGELQIEEHEADVIRRIFQDYAEGASPRQIAHDLNAEGVLAPRGARWNASTLNGSADRGYGILRNAIYAGVLVWDRVRMVLDPITGKRVSRVKPREAWKYAEVPHLRIVGEELWDAVQERLMRQSHAKFAGKSTRTPARPFSGLLKCGCCGGGMAIHDRKGSAIRIACSMSRESGSCANSGKFRLDQIEDQIFAALHDHLLHPAYIEEYISAYGQERKALAETGRADQGKLERAVAEARNLFERRLVLYERGVLDGDDGEAKLLEAKNGLQSAEAELSSLANADEVIAFDPATPARYASALRNLVTSLTTGGEKPDIKARDAVRSLVSEIIVSRPENDSIPVEVRGRLSALISNSVFQVGGVMVAEEGLEPPTRGL
ncbi:recombinase family protein [Yangia pacifica]|uniref:recombinase family protein n=1 Tax=Alloyangia pacifica TaxID=311180 RepID=UPI001CD622F9|nr:recombinase family protein [Alloyangia pacifica]